jgi:hypothetical protein
MQLRQEPGATATWLLTRFRSEGRACLDTRFRQMIQAVRDDHEKGLFA